MTTKDGPRYNQARERHSTGRGALSQTSDPPQLAVPAFVSHDEQELSLVQYASIFCSFTVQVVALLGGFLGAMHVGQLLL